MCHVLIIEDEILIALDLQYVLEAEGATSVVIADTEAEAIAAALAQKPDVITSDVRIRDGSGPNAVAAIQSEVGPVPVIYITANPDACASLQHTAPVLAKPLLYAQIAAVFRAVAPINS